MFEAKIARPTVFQPRDRPGEKIHVAGLLEFAGGDQTRGQDSEQVDKEDNEINNRYSQQARLNPALSWVGKCLSDRGDS